MRSLHSYTTVVIPDDNGTFVAQVPALPGCHAWGATPEEAQQELISVFEMIQDEYREAGKPLPENVDLVVAHAC
jgi:predicted RNase H-like HicB family nuclease